MHTLKGQIKLNIQVHNQQIWQFSLLFNSLPAGKKKKLNVSTIGYSCKARLSPDYKSNRNEDYYFCQLINGLWV